MEKKTAYSINHEAKPPVWYTFYNEYLAIMGYKGKRSVPEHIKKRATELASIDYKKLVGEKD